MLLLEPVKKIEVQDAHLGENLGSLAEVLSNMGLVGQGAYKTVQGWKLQVEVGKG